jgi:MFS family permease
LNEKNKSQLRLEMLKNSFSTWYKDPVTKLGFMNFFSMMSLTLYRGYLPIYLTNDIIVSVLIFTLIISSINFFQMFMRIPLGSLSQMLGRKKLILFGNLAISLAVILLFVANSYIFVFISAILVAIGMSAHWPATFSYIQDVNSSSYGKNNGRVFKLGDIGILLGSLYAKIFLDQFLLGLRLFFLSLAILGLISIIAFYFFLPETLSLDQRMHTTKKEFINDTFFKMIIQLKEITLYPKMIKVYAFQIILSFSEFFFVVFFPLLLESLGYSKGSLGEIIFWSTFILLWMKPYLGGISDRFCYRFPVLLSLTCLAFIYFITPLIKELSFLILLYFLANALFFVGYPAVNSATASTSPVKQRGLALGALGVYTSLGRASSTIIMSPIWYNFNINITFMVSGILIFFVVLVLFLKSKEIEDIRVN